jgi:mevalonate kinase
MTEGRAPGKVLLLGEHAVVYGQPALAAAIPLFVQVSVEPAAEPRIELPRGVQTPFPVLEAAVAMAREAGFAGGFLARVESEIPLGSGLGSSAALGVSLARAFKPGCSPDQAARLAMHLERVLHGAPSGVDPAACARGGVIFFTRGEPPKIEEVNASAWLVVALTGIARGTHTTVMPLSQRRAREPELIDPLLARLGELTRAGRRDLESGDAVALGASFDEAHAILRELEVSCAELDEKAAALKAAGALGAKLTGAGGGGAAIGLARDQAQALAIAAATGGFAVRIGPR